MSLARPGRQLRIRGDDAERLLVLEDLIAQRVLPLVEEMHRANLLDPLRRRVVRGVRAAGQ